MKPQCTIDLGSITHAEYFYEQQEGNTLKHMPRFPTVHCVMFDPKEFAFPYLHEYPSETKLERARRLDLLDKWKPVCIYHFRNNVTQTFKGEAAKRKWKTYNKHIYKT